MSYDVKVIADSIGPNDARLTTMQLRMPRFILAQFNTHRALCLAGDSILEFDLPGGTKGRDRRVYKMRLDEFVDKWHNGANRTKCNPKEDRDTTWVSPEKEYTPSEVASGLGMATSANILTMCRKGVIQAIRSSDNRWLIPGSEVLAWRNSTPEHSRFDMTAKLSNMRIRQLNEDTGDIQNSTVVSAIRSGVKDVFELRAGEFRVAGSKDHRIMTSEGWKPIEAIRPGDFVVVRKFGKKEDEKADPSRLQKIDGIWRSKWQFKIREEMAKADPLCRRCRILDGVDIHHVVPVHVDPSRALDRGNVTLLCEPCHNAMHSEQGWQTSHYLYGALAKVDEIDYRGREETYDLEIAGPYPNFVANGIVVHNSKNARSSRAVPTEKLILEAETNPFIPLCWGRNRRGMQSTEDLSRTDAWRSEQAWLDARDAAVAAAHRLLDIGLHKQVANRLLEPFLWVDVVATATDWANYFALRCHDDAQPEHREIAVLMARAYRDSTPVKRPGKQTIQFPSDAWHLPYVTTTEREERGIATLQALSAARSARVSYFAHDGTKSSAAEDINLHDKLRDAPHWSPFEHQGRCQDKGVVRRSGNFNGWDQYRQSLPKPVHTEFDFASIDPPSRRKRRSA